MIPGYTLSGTVKYDNLSLTPIDSAWISLRLNGTIIDSTQADTCGNYQFSLVQSGTYTLTGRTHKLWGGVNSTDAVKVKRHFAGMEYFTTSIRLHAADVNNSMNINTTDAVKITRRFVSLDPSFTRPDWLFENSTGGDTVGVSQTLNDTVIVNGANTVQNLKALCEGDVNGSYTPPSTPSLCNLITPPKASPKVEMTNDEVIKLGQREYGEIPIRVTEGMNVGAISLILDYKFHS